MPDFLNGLFFSEILADNAGSGAVNVNGQGGANKQDEFIEIQNNSGTTVDLGGYQIWSQVNGRLHLFDAGDTIDPGETATVIGAYTNPPDGFFVATDNPNPNGNANGGFLLDGENALRDTIYLVAPNGDYIRLSYGAPAEEPTSLPTDPDFVFPPGGTQQGVGETIDSGAPNATSILRDAEGNLTEGTPTPGEPGPVCFCAGTLITTDQGDVPVENLRPGMRILTRDRGFLPLMAMRAASIARQVLNWHPDMRPIKIPGGLFGDPRSLRVSPPHRVLIRSALAELYFGVSEVLVPARQMVGHAGICVDITHAPVQYFHLLFESHEIIRAGGIWSESLFLGDAAHAAIVVASGWQVQRDCCLEDIAHKRTARMVLKGYESAQLLHALGHVKAAMAAVA